MGVNFNKYGTLSIVYKQPMHIPNQQLERSFLTKVSIQVL